MERACIYTNGVIRPMTHERAVLEAVLVQGGRIAATGPFKALRRRASDARVVDLQGAAMLPGFIDGHSHFTAVAQRYTAVNIAAPPTGPCETLDDIEQTLRKAIGKRKNGGWLIGMSYDNTVLPREKHPTRQMLDRVSLAVPIILMHVSGHLCVVNSAGMQKLGYGEAPYDVPAGGVVQPDGLLKEQAFLSPEKLGRIEGPSHEERLAAIRKAGDYYASFGYTTVQDGRTGPAEYDWLCSAQREDLLKLDVAMYLTPALAEEKLERQFPAINGYDGHLKRAGCKIFLDGSPQGKTAWLSAPYHVPPQGAKKGDRGFPLYASGPLQKLLENVISNQWQLNAHCNGDAAIEQLIDCYAAALEKKGGGRGLRPVVIHCQTVRDDQLARMRELGLSPSFFLDHVYYWGDYHAASVLGPSRAARISPLRSALEHGLRFTLHQDAPVVPPNPIFSVHNAVNRRTRQGKLLGGEQRVTTFEALRALTCWGAWQLFEEDEKGRIEPGKRADFAVLSRDPLQTPNAQLKNIGVLRTIKDGETVFSAE